MKENLSQDYVRTTPLSPVEKAAGFYESGDTHFKKFWMATCVFYIVYLGLTPQVGAIFLAEAARQAFLGIRDYEKAHRIMMDEKEKKG